VAQGVNPGIAVAPLCERRNQRLKGTPVIDRRYSPRSSGGGGRGRGRIFNPTADAVGHMLTPLPGLFVGKRSLSADGVRLFPVVATTNRRFESSWARRRGNAKTHDEEERSSWLPAGSSERRKPGWRLH
jgi:hypothetical protein